MYAFPTPCFTPPHAPHPRPAAPNLPLLRTIRMVPHWPLPGIAPVTQPVVSQLLFTSVQDAAFSLSGGCSSVQLKALLLMPYHYYNNVMDQNEKHTVISHTHTKN